MSSIAPPSRRTYVENLVFVLLAALLLEAVRCEHARAPAWHVAELVASLSAVAARAWRLRRRGDAPESSRDAGAIAVAIVFAPLAWEAVGRATNWHCQSPEYLWMNVVRNLALVLAAGPATYRPWRLSSPLALFLGLGCLASLDRPLDWALAATFALVGLFRLASGGWDRLSGKFAAQTRAEAPRGVLIAVVAGCLLVVLAAGSRLVGWNSTTALGGFFPSGGGERWNDPFASGGVGDGDQLVGAKDEARGFGPVESELFLESKQPSLYDVANDLYGPPQRNDRHERVVALESSVKLQLDHRKKSQTQQAGREFSTVRRRSGRPVETPTRLSDALVFVGGRTPLHLRVETFDRFDGREWTRSDGDEPTPQPTMARHEGRPWLRLAQGPPATFLGPPERHLLKVVRLDSPRIPLPVHPLGVHIDRIEDASFFAWSRDGALSLAGREKVPPLQVIHLESCAIDRFRLADETPRPPRIVSQKYGESDVAPPSARLVALAREWTRGLPRGWRQITEVERRLRSEYVLDATSRAAPDVADSVEEFLFETRRGPDYLFASAAARLLRALDYPARLVAGLYASPERYDRRARLTPVHSVDLHVWTEVCVDRNVWVTVEPTPGYEPLAPPHSWREIATRALLVLSRTLSTHPLVVAAVLAAAAAAWRGRRALEDAASGLAWRIASRLAPRRRIVWTLWLLERRAKLAGRARRPTTTLARHYGPLAADATEASRVLRRFLDEASRALYSRRTFAAGDARDDETVRAHLCEQVARHWTRRRLAGARDASPRALRDLSPFSVASLMSESS